jgi:hypothetical protein
MIDCAACRPSFSCAPGRASDDDAMARGNQRSMKSANAGLVEEDYRDLIDFERSTRHDERQKAALAYAEAITWDLPVDDAFWARLHRHFSEPELVVLGWFSRWPIEASFPGLLRLSQLGARQVGSLVYLRRVPARRFQSGSPKDLRRFARASSSSGNAP